jgi:Domain of unknown function (DUF4397)
LKKYIIYLFVITLMISCSDDNSDAARAYVRIINGSPDAGNINLTFGSTIVIGNVSYQSSGAFTRTDPGKYLTSITPVTGSWTPQSADYTYYANSYYTVIISDSAKNASATIQEDGRGAPAAGKCHLRIFHLLGNGTNSVDITYGSESLYTARTFNDHKTNGNIAAYKDVTPGTQTITVKTVGTSTVVTSLPNISFQAGRKYTACIFGFAGGTGSSAPAMALYDDN